MTPFLSPRTGLLNFLFQHGSACPFLVDQRLRSSSHDFSIFLQVPDRLLFQVAPDVTHRSAVIFQHLVQMFTNLSGGSSVRAGIGTRTTLPSPEDLKPKSDERIALSIIGTALASHGEITMLIGSGTVTVPSRVERASACRDNPRESNPAAPRWRARCAVPPRPCRKSATAFSMRNFTLAPRHPSHC